MGKMSHRIAKKIVNRFQADPASAGGYETNQLVRAHRRMGVELTSDALDKWRQPKAVERNIEKVTTEANRARATIRRIRAADQKALKARAKGSKPEAQERIETGVPQLDQALAQGIPSALDDMNVTALRALCKERGLAGYSKMPKPDLIKLLKG